MGVACLKIRGENFRRWLKNREIHKEFLPQKFPAIRYFLVLGVAKREVPVHPWIPLWIHHCQVRGRDYLVPKC